METILWIILLQALFCGCFCSFVAKEKNRDRAAWFLNGFFFSLIALIAVSGLPSLSALNEADKLINKLK
jgi:hypothetical protein